MLFLKYKTTLSCAKLLVFEKFTCVGLRNYTFQIAVLTNRNEDKQSGELPRFWLEERERGGRIFKTTIRSLNREWYSSTTDVKISSCWRDKAGSWLTIEFATSFLVLLLRNHKIGFFKDGFNLDIKHLTTWIRKEVFYLLNQEPRCKSGKCWSPLRPNWTDTLRKGNGPPSPLKKWKQIITACNILYLTFYIELNTKSTLEGDILREVIVNRIFFCAGRCRVTELWWNR